MASLIDGLFALTPAIRYVATYLDGVHLSGQRPGIEGASSSESDKYEELLVNPTLLKLVTQRGNPLAMAEQVLTFIEGPL